MPENLQPPRAASRILSCFGSPHLPQILGDLMEEYNERAQSTGLSAAGAGGRYFATSSLWQVEVKWWARQVQGRCS